MLEIPSRMAKIMIWRMKALSFYPRFTCSLEDPWESFFADRKHTTESAFYPSIHGLPSWSDGGIHFAQKNPHHNQGIHVHFKRILHGIYVAWFSLLFLYFSFPLYPIWSMPVIVWSLSLQEIEIKHLIQSINCV